MELALILSRLLLSVMFAVAALAKLADQDGTRTAIRDFGIRPNLAGTVAVVLPVAELLVAAALIPTTTAGWGALGAIVLLLAFVAAISTNLRRGRKPDCRCFGQLKPTPIGSSTLVRNGLLMALAVVVAASSWSRARPGITHSFTGVTALQVGVVLGIVLVVAVVSEGWMLLGLMAQQGRLLTRLEAVEGSVARGSQATAPYVAGLPIGSLAPEFSLPTTTGAEISLELLRWPGRPVMLVFTDPYCGGCRELLPDVEAWYADDSSTFAVALISREGEAYGSLDGPPVLLQKGDEVSELYKVAGTPSAVVVRADGIIAAPLVSGPDAVRQLAHTMNGEPCGDPERPRLAEGLNRPVLTLPRAPEVGRPAPTVDLDDVDGHPVRLSDFRDEEVALLFWSPTCDFCQLILEDLKSVESDQGSRQLLFVTSGSSEEIRGQGLRSPVLMDEGARVAASYGADGTPMGVLIDSDGNIASTMVAGAPAVLDLVQSPPLGVVAPSGSNGHKPGTA